jgi:DNA-binding IclR family transcriptional regulator
MSRPRATSDAPARELAARVLRSLADYIDVAADAREPADLAGMDPATFHRLVDDLYELAGLPRPYGTR